MDRPQHDTTRTTVIREAKHRDYCTLTQFSTSADLSVIASSASYLTQQSEWLELVSKATKYIFKWTCYPRNLTVTILLVLQCLMAEIYFIFKESHNSNYPTS